MRAAESQGGAAACGPTAEQPPTRTVVISWVEECHHEVRVRVPLDFEPDERDLANGLAELSNDGYQWLQRAGIAVDDIDDDPSAEYFDPPIYGEGF